jgi:hypothetical protein
MCREDGIAVANRYRINSQYPALAVAFHRLSHLFRPRMKVGLQNLSQRCQGEACQTCYRSRNCQSEGGCTKRKIAKQTRARLIRDGTEPPVWGEFKPVAGLDFVRLAKPSQRTNRSSDELRWRFPTPMCFR